MIAIRELHQLVVFYHTSYYQLDKFQKKRRKGQTDRHPEYSFYYGFGSKACHQWDPITAASNMTELSLRLERNHGRAFLTSGRYVRHSIIAP